MGNKVVKLGVVGLKRGAYVAWKIIGDDNVVIRAIADRDPKALQDCKKDYEKNGVKDLLCFDNIEDLLKSDIDAVYIATDKPLHTRHTIMALEAGKHVISEIPIIEALEEAHSFAKLYESKESFERAFEIPVKLSKNNDPYGHGGADGTMMRDFIRCIIEDIVPPIRC